MNLGLLKIYLNKLYQIICNNEKVMIVIVFMLLLLLLSSPFLACIMLGMLLFIIRKEHK
jgi:hypothetical protein